MTNKEAIEILNMVKAYGLAEEAKQMAIKALENHDTFMKYSYEQGKKDALSQEPCRVKNELKVELNELKPCIDAVSREEALEALNTINGTAELDKAFEVIEKLPSVNPQPCDDAISRDFLFRVLDNFCGHDRTATITLDILADIVYELPSVTQKSGKWINDKDDMPTCSKCGYIPPYSTVIDDYEYSNYCPHCGSDMRGAENEV